MDPILWTNLPRELVYKICNMLALYIHRKPPELLEDVRNQMYIFDRVYYNYIGFYGISSALVWMFDDIQVYKSKRGLKVYPLGDDEPIDEDLVLLEWKESLGPDDRMAIWEKII